MAAETPRKETTRTHAELELWPTPAQGVKKPHLNTQVPPAPRPKTSLGQKEIFPTTTVSCSASGGGESRECQLP